MSLSVKNIVFAMTENLRSLARSMTWFANGTFSTALTIFFQVFTVMGTVNVPKNKNVALTFVYCLLKNKKKKSVQESFQCHQGITKRGIAFTQLTTIMADFEMEIINAVKEDYGKDKTRCIFHLCESVYHHIQSEGLVAAYCNKEDRCVKIATKSFCTLVFVPINHVKEHFDALQINFPAKLNPKVEYFQKNIHRRQSKWASWTIKTSSKTSTIPSSVVE